MMLKARMRRKKNTVYTGFEERDTLEDLVVDIRILITEMFLNE